MTHQPRPIDNPQRAFLSKNRGKSTNFVFLRPIDQSAIRNPQLVSAMKPRLALALALIISLAPRLLADESPIQSGPMVGHAEMRAAILWVQTKREAKVHFEAWIEGQPAGAIRSREVTTRAEDAFVAKLTLAPLEPGQRYEFATVVDGQRVGRAYPQRFRTPPLWQWRTDPPDFTVAAGSCLYINDPPFDRPGKPYGGDYGILTAIADKHPDAMVWLGDNCYLREADSGLRESVLYRYTHSRSTPELQSLLASCPHYMIWDDHDYGTNDSDRGFRDKVVTRQVFELFSANPTYGFPERPKLISTRFEWGDAEFFLCDDRTDRAPNQRKTGDRPFLGREQVRWLVDALISSPATFKIICIGNQVLNPAAGPEIETYAHYPEEQRELLEAIRAEGIAGVVFLSGDRHHTELTRLPREGTYALYDLTTSPLTAAVSTRGEFEKNVGRVEGTYLTQRNFALLKFSGAPAARVLTLQVCRGDGSLAWERRIEAKELK